MPNPYPKTAAEVLTEVRAKVAKAEKNRETANAIITKIRDACEAGNRDPNEAEATAVIEARAVKANIDVELSQLRAELADAERDAESERLSREVHPTGHGKPSYGDDDFTYDPSDPTDKKGARMPVTTGPRFVRTDSNRGEVATVARGQRFAEHPAVQAELERNKDRDAQVVAQFGDMGQFVRSLTTSGTAAVVPTVWFADIIDRARNESRVFQAGASIVPMDAKTVQIGRLTGDPTAAFRTEGSLITASDPTFDNVTLTAQTMSVHTVGSMEWFQDAPNADQLVMDAIGKAIGLQLDLVALYGGITSGAGSITLATPPNPRGVLASLNANLPANVLGAATNGTTQTATSFYTELINTLYQVRRGNEEPNAMIYSPRLGAKYANAYDTTGQPLGVPPVLVDFTRLESGQVPSYTQGTMANVATDVFCGDWQQLLIGQRLDMTLKVLTERYAENGQVGIVAHWRGDAALARNTAFAVYRALQGV